MYAWSICWRTHLSCSALAIVVLFHALSLGPGRFLLFFLPLVGAPYPVGITSSLSSSIDDVSERATTIAFPFLGGFVFRFFFTLLLSPPLSSSVDDVSERATTTAFFFLLGFVFRFFFTLVSSLSSSVDVSERATTTAFLFLVGFVLRFFFTLVSSSPLSSSVNDVAGRGTAEVGLPGRGTAEVARS
jgi:hypothetical protein